MSQWSNRQQLMSCLLLSEALWRDFSDWRLRASTDGEEIGFKIWVDSIAEYYSVWSRMPDEVSLQTIASNRMAGLSSEQLMIVQRDCYAAAAMAGSWRTRVPPEQLEQQGRLLLTVYLESMLAVKAATVMQDVPTGAGDILKSLQKDLTAVAGINGTRFKQVFPEGDFPPMPDNAYQTLGLQFVNLLCGGGLVIGDVVGQAAPIGSGKTTLAFQIAYDRAKSVYATECKAAILANRQVSLKSLPQVYVFVYENVVTIRAMLASMAAEIPRKTAELAMLRGVAKAGLSSCKTKDYKDYEWQLYGKQLKAAEQGMEPYPWGELERYQNAVMIINNILQLVDFSGHDVELQQWSEQGEAGMVAYIRAHQNLVGNPGVNFVVLDYVGAMIDTGIRAGRIRMSDITNNIKMTPNNLSREIAGPFKCPVWAAQQLSPEENSKAGGTIPNPGQAAGSRMFLEYCSVGIASGKLSPDGIGVFVLGKSRRGATAGAPMHLARLGAQFARWESAEDFVLVEGTIMPKNETVGQKLPSRRLPGGPGFGEKYA